MGVGENRLKSWTYKKKNIGFYKLVDQPGKKVSDSQAKIYCTNSSTFPTIPFSKNFFLQNLTSTSIFTALPLSCGSDLVLWLQPVHLRSFQCFNFRRSYIGYDFIVKKRATCLTLQICTAGGQVVNVQNVFFLQIAENG